VPNKLLCVLGAGVKSLVRPLSSWYSGSSKGAGSSAQPVVAFDDLQQLPKPEPLTLTKQLRDDERMLEALVPAPVGTLLVSPDNLGRVLLLDGADMVAVRIWKVWVCVCVSQQQPPAASATCSTTKDLCAKHTCHTQCVVCVSQVTHTV
jgi:hypothetical protein